jgi:phospholipid/cholesterol/gamma-HCH transport system ATP-binding protein
MTVSPEAPLLETRGVTVRYDGRAAIQNVDVRVQRDEILYVMGPTRCGKTTLLKCLAGLIRPDEGEVLFEGRRLEPEGGRTRDALRGAAGFLFQGGALFSSMSLSDNVALPMRVRLGLSGPILEEAVRMKLAQVGLLDAAQLQPSELSDGMLKRAGIARALALDPSLLFLDEPTGGLDPVTAAEIDTLVGQLRADLGAPIVVASHDLASAQEFADRIIMMVSGRAIVEGDWPEVRASQDDRVHAFLDPRGRPIPGARLAPWEEP